MDRNPLRGTQVNTVEQSALWARELTRREARGPGDIESAWHRLERRYGVPFRAFWALRYRRPKSITAEIYVRLCAAYQAECDRQMRMLAHEIEIAKAKVGPLHPTLVAASRVVDEANE